LSMGPTDFTDLADWLVWSLLEQPWFKNRRASVLYSQAV
jgi:hypothetical protein